MGNIVIECIDDTSLESFILKRWLAVRRCPEGPLSDQFQVRKKQSQQETNDTDHRMGFKQNGRENDACGEDQNWQDMILLTQAIEQRTTSC